MVALPTYLGFVAANPFLTLFFVFIGIIRCPLALGVWTGCHLEKYFTVPLSPV